MPAAALLLLTLLAATDPVADTPAPAKLEFPLAGYRINALDRAPKDFFGLTMYLPVSSDNFFFKVDIMSQTLKAGSPSLQNQVKETRSYFTQSGNAILQDRALSPSEWLFEFTTMGRDHAGPKEHVYERMIYAYGKSYVIAASARDSQWAELGPKFKTSVDSFELSSDQVPGKVSFSQQGFRFSVLDGAAPADAKQGLLMTATNLGPQLVTIEPYTKTLKDYQAERKPPMIMDSKHQFKILTENLPAENALVTEYAEEFPADKSHPQGGEVLTYEKVLIAHGHLYRVLAILTNEPDAKAVTQIKAWVDSLEAMPVPAPALAPVK